VRQIARLSAIGPEPEQRGHLQAFSPTPSHLSMQLA
jgi:hypothetical protein